MPNIDTPEIQFALKAVRQASILTSQIQAELVSPALIKADLSPVTVADFASQALISHILAETLVDDRLVAEEDSSALRDSAHVETLELVTRYVERAAPGANPKSVCSWIDHGRVDSGPRFWALDPIDGTKGFLRGEQYVVALALVEGGQVQFGVLGCPNLVDGYRPDPGGQGSLVLAIRGQGTWTTPMDRPGEFARLQVSERKDPRQARILRSFEAGHTNVTLIDRFANALGVQAEPVLMDSQAKYAVLAAGKGDLIVRLLSPSKPDYREKIWDQAAGSLVLEEAGGRITDLDGQALDFNTGRTLKNNRGVLASNARLHEAALLALKDIGA